MEHKISGEQILSALDKKALKDILDAFIANYCNGDVNNFYNVSSATRYEQFGCKYEKQIIDDINNNLLTDKPYKLKHLCQGSAYTNSCNGDAELQDNNHNKILAIDFKWAILKNNHKEAGTPTLQSLQNFGQNDNHYYVCFSNDLTVIEIYNANTAYLSRKEAGDYENSQNLGKHISSGDTNRFFNPKRNYLCFSTQSSIFQYPVRNISVSFDANIKSKINKLVFMNTECDESLIIRYKNNNINNTLGNEYQIFLGEKNFVLSETDKKDSAMMITGWDNENTDFFTVHFDSLNSKKSIDISFNKKGKILKEFLESEANKEFIRDDNKFYSIDFL